VAHDPNIPTPVFDEYAARILALMVATDAGWSRGEISRELGLSRESVGKVMRGPYPHLARLFRRAGTRPSLYRRALLYKPSRQAVAEIEAGSLVLPAPPASDDTALADAVARRLAINVRPTSVTELARFTGIHPLSVVRVLNTQPARFRRVSTHRWTMREQSNTR